MQPPTTMQPSPTSPGTFADWLETLRDALGARGHRALVCLSGEAGWARRQAGGVRSPGAAVWVGKPGDQPEGWSRIEAVEARTRLGVEVDTVVWDARAGFDPDGFGAISGALRAGGVLLLLTPPLEAWPATGDPEHSRIAVDGYPPEAVRGRFLRRLAQCLAEDESAWLIRQAGGPWPSVPTPDAVPEALPERRDGCRSGDQWRAVAAILRVMRGRRRRPLVLTADRGRGKSAALGLAAARLVEERPGLRVLVTAPRREQCEAVFRHAGPLPPVYHTPAELAQSLPEADLLLVDEAAGISPLILARLLHHYSRVVFATTLHGYEGTGRGFAIRFRQILDRDAPGWRPLHMDEPVRWRPGDPLERFTFHALLLDAQAAPVEAIDVTDEVRYQRLDRDALATDEGLLGSLFGLLVQAHYRTRPMDLRNLLDGPNLRIHAALLGGAVVGAALVAEEGGFPADVAEAIWDGRRRPQGHLLPQALAAHVGLRRGACQHALRVMRIAVHPGLQRRGIGSALIRSVVESAGDDGPGLMGASFGATPELLHFWWRNGFLPLRVGMRQDAASGTHSVLVARSLSPGLEQLVQEGRERFRRELPWHLRDALRELDPGMADAVLCRLLAESPPAPDEWAELAAFAGASRAFEASLASLGKAALWALTCPEPRAGLTAAQRHLLIMRLLQSRPWQESASRLDLGGRAGIVAELRRIVAALVAVAGTHAARAALTGYGYPAGIVLPPGNPKEEPS